MALVRTIEKTGGDWLVVDRWFGRFYTSDEEVVVGLDVHLDADDPTFRFQAAADWPELSPRIVEQYNAPYRRRQRLALRRAVNDDPRRAIMVPHYRAELQMDLVRAGRENTNPDGFAVAHLGGVVRGVAPGESGHGDTDAALFAAVDLWRARAEQRWRHADVNRAAIEHVGFDVSIDRSGAVRFVRRVS
jgi:hypothetical protein